MLPWTCNRPTPHTPPRCTTVFVWYNPDLTSPEELCRVAQFYCRRCKRTYGIGADPFPAARQSVSQVR